MHIPKLLATHIWGRAGVGKRIRGNPVRVEMGSAPRFKGMRWEEPLDNVFLELLVWPWFLGGHLLIELSGYRGDDCWGCPRSRGQCHQRGMKMWTRRCRWSPASQRTPCCWSSARDQGVLHVGGGMAVMLPEDVIEKGIH